MAVDTLASFASEHSEAFEALVGRAQPKAWTALSAWGKLRNQEMMTEQDGRALAELVSVQDEDDEDRRTGREALFNALWRTGKELGVVA
jgi:hypothetical protein